MVRERKVGVKSSTLCTRIIPCLDVRNGRVVKGIRFSNLRDIGSPAELGEMYEQQGADEIVFLDISASDEGRLAQIETISSVRKRLSIPLTSGGGISRVEDAGRLLRAGADKVSVNSSAVKNPQLIREIATKYGRQCAVLAVDAMRVSGSEGNPAGWEVVIQSGKTRTGLDVMEWLRTGESLGAGEILLTSWDQDGTRSGYDLELLRAASQIVSVPIIASGGAATPAHLAAAYQAGADALLAASLFHDGDFTVDQVKFYLRDQGIPVRLIQGRANLS